LATTTVNKNNHKYVQTRRIEEGASQQQSKSAGITTTVTTNPGNQLISLKKEISKTIEEIKKLGGNTDSLENTLTDCVHKIDNYMGTKLHSGLVSRFGNHGWKVRVDNYSRPFLSKSSKNDYRYILKNISWTNGPNPRQVFFYVLENFKYYLQSYEFDSRMFTRLLPGIDKRYRCEYLPLPMNGKDFLPIEINISRVYNKINDTVTLQYYLIDAVDTKLGIQNIRGETKEEVFTKFQEALETIYYSPTYSPQYKQLARSERIISASDDVDSEAEEAQEVPPPPPAAPPADSVEEREPGEPSGSDYHDVDSDSIPEENPDVTGEVVPQSVYDPDHDGDVDQPGVPDNDLLPSGETPSDMDPDHDGDIDVPGVNDHDADDMPPAASKANEGEEEDDSYNAEESDENYEASVSTPNKNTLIFS
jgi:hypothetical protein